ncbi:MAG TPA: NrdH-redoxin [Bacteroidales bacterium]|nr:NrdH-redoxin [Bacteroidales bacterium]
MKHIQSHNELLDQVHTHTHIYLLLYKGNSDLSQCAVKNINKVRKDDANYTVLFADVNKVKDIHANYGITTVPSLLEFQKGEYQKVIKGCNSPNFYKSVFENIVSPLTKNGKQKLVKSVTVYSTPSCPWCTKLKNYLQQNNIQFRDIDVSRNQSAAERMFKSSGQRGVPQTEINGQFIVVFDKPKIDKLLNINSN